MARSGPAADMQFRYWDMNRKGRTQSQIARDFGISRQAVNKSVKLFERDVMYRLLEGAQTTGALVEWFDAGKGVLIGRTPQLGNIPCLMLIDYRNRVRTFYDQSGNPGREAARSTMEELKNILRDSLSMDIRGEVTFKTVLKIVYDG